MKKWLLEAEDLLVADHGVCFTGPGGSIGKDSGVKAVEDSFDEGMSGFEIDLCEGGVTF